MRFFTWLLSIIMAFSIGAGVSTDKASDSELKQKVQGHLDVIVDEGAAIVDDVMDELRKNERFQEAEEFVNDIREIVDNTREDIEDHFGKPEENAGNGTSEETEGTEESPAVPE